MRGRKEKERVGWRIEAKQQLINEEGTKGETDNFDFNSNSKRWYSEVKEFWGGYLQI